MRSVPRDRKTSHPSSSASSPVSTDAKRRRFLFALGASGAGAAAVAAVPLAATAATSAASTAATSDGSSYRETEHVRDYYDSARL